VTWKGQAVTSVCLWPIISSMAGDRDSVTMEHPQEMATWGIKWSRDW